MNLLDSAAARLRAAGIEHPRAEARLLLEHALGVSREAVIAQTVTPDAAGLARFEAVLARRERREPLAYITGRREFWSLPFSVTPGVLIPRPETETLVEEALKQFPVKAAPLKVLDLGTGSGCLLLAFLSERPNARGAGVDCSPDAFACASRNASALGLSERARFVEGGWDSAPEESFDVIFANPPYIVGSEISGLEPDVAAYEPRLALDGGADGLDAYRSIALLLARRLAADGYAFLEIGQGQAAMVSELLSASGLEIAATVADLAAIPRCLVVRPGRGTHPVSRKKGLEIASRSG